MTQSSIAPYSVLFDLDGTLLDTAPDLANALNAVLIAKGREPLPFDTIRPMVSHGGNALIKLGFGIEIDAPGFAELREQFLEVYQNNIAAQTRPFPGIEQLLNHLEQQHIPWGVVTNKPSWLTQPLMAALGLDKRAACIVSGDTAEHAKPHPAPLFLACRETGHDPQHCIYIGDHQRDIEAGKRAGMKTLVALFGYIEASDDPANWQADGAISTPLETLNFLNKWKVE